MRINEIFTNIGSAGFSEITRVAVQDAVRAILEKRRSLGIDNDVADLFEHRESIAAQLAIPTDVMDRVFQVPNVRASLATNASWVRFQRSLSPSAEQTEIAFDTSDDDDGDDAEDEEDDDGDDDYEDEEDDDEEDEAVDTIVEEEEDADEYRPLLDAIRWENRDTRIAVESYGRATLSIQLAQLVLFSTATVVCMVVWSAPEETAECTRMARTWLAGAAASTWQGARAALAVVRAWAH